MNDYVNCVQKYLKIPHLITHWTFKLQPIIDIVLFDVFYDNYRINLSSFLDLNFTSG